MCFCARTRTVPVNTVEVNSCFATTYSEKMKTQDNFLRQAGSWHGHPLSFWRLIHVRMVSTWEQIKWGWEISFYFRWSFRPAGKLKTGVSIFWDDRAWVSLSLHIMQMWQSSESVFNVFTYGEMYIPKDEPGKDNWPLEALLRAKSNPLVLVWAMLEKLVCVHVPVASLRWKGHTYLIHEMNCWSQNPLLTYVEFFLGQQKEDKSFPKWDRKFLKNEIIFIVGERQKKYLKRSQMDLYFCCQQSQDEGRILVHTHLVSTTGYSRADRFPLGGLGSV